MSSDDVAACRQRLESHLITLVGTKSGLPESPVTETECASLIENVETIWTRNREVPWTLDPSPTDTALRELLLDLISTLSISEPEFVEVWYLLDIATILADNDLSEPSSNFLLIENLLDSQTVSGCRKVFDYLESRRDKLLAHNFDKKQLVILRCCNELLRRLSRAEDTVFCGRVFIFLFQSFELGDKSSVNLRGEFHTDNVTHFDPTPKKSEDAIKPMEIDTDSVRPVSSGGQTPASIVAEVDTSQRTGRSTPIPSKLKSETKGQAPPDLDTLFPQFWSLQSLFSQPMRLFEPTAMTQFKDGMAATLACFKSLSTTTATNGVSSDRGVKRKRNETDGVRSSQPYNPKYLTNRDLFDLEVHDVAFRRHFLTQCLIMLDFLLALSPVSKAKMQGSTNKSVLYSFTLPEDDVKYCQTMRQSIATYLQQQGPGLDGKYYYRMVDAVLSRDKNWARWKADNCPKILKNAVELGTYLSAQKSLCDMTAKRPFANPPGATDFGFLSMSEPLEALKHPSKRQTRPTLEQYYNEIENAKLDEDFATEDEKKDIQEKIQGSLWRALRVSTLDGRRFELCEQIKDGVNLKALVGLEGHPAEEPEEGPSKGDEKQEEPTTNGHIESTTEAARTSNANTPIPPADGAQDIPESVDEGVTEAPAAEQEAEGEGDVEGEAEDESEFAPPGAMDLDKQSGSGEQPTEAGAVDSTETTSAGAADDMGATPEAAV